MNRRFLLVSLSFLALLGAGCDVSMISIVNPGSGSSFTSEQTVRIDARVDDWGPVNGQLQQVEFLRNGGVVCTDASAPFVCDWPVTAADNGSHTWVARADLGAHGVMASAPVQVQVSIDGGPGEPGLIGFVPGVGSALDVVADPSSAFVASGSLGLSVISDPTSAAASVAAASTSGFQGEHVAVSGTRAVATGVAEDGTSSLWVLDVLPGQWPQVVGELSTSLVPGSTTGFHDVGLADGGDLAIVAAGSDGLWVIDVSDPEAPALIGSYDDPAWNSWSLGVAVDDSAARAYVADGGKGLKVIDLSVPSQPSLLGERALSGTQLHVAVSGNRAYVINQGGAMRVLDVANPANPVWLGTSGMSGVGVRVAVEGTRVAAVSTDLAGTTFLDVFDVSNPALPVRTGAVPVGPEGSGVALESGMALVAAGSEGVKVYDAASPSLPMSAHLEDTFEGQHLAGDGDLVVAVGEDRATGHSHLQVLDLSQPAAPVKAGELATSIVPTSVSGFRDVAYSGARSLAVVAAGSDGVMVVDVSNPSNPQIVGSYDTAGWAFGLALDPSGTTVYVADGYAGLSILDVTVPSQPALLGSMSLSGTQLDVAVAGNTAYVTSQGATVWALDVSDPAAIRWTGIAGLSGFGSEIAVDGDLAVVLSGAAGNDVLDVLDLSSPGQPVLVGSHAVAPAGEAGGVDVSGSVAAVATGDGGLLVASLADPAQPTTEASGLGIGQVGDVVLDGPATVCTTGFPAAVSIVGL